MSALRDTPGVVLVRCGPGWIHEIKHDSFRVLAERDAKGVTLRTRRGYVATWLTAVRDQAKSSRKAPFHLALRSTGTCANLAFHIRTVLSLRE